MTQNTVANLLWQIKATCKVFQTHILDDLLLGSECKKVLLQDIRQALGQL